MPAAALLGSALGLPSARRELPLIPCCCCCCYCSHSDLIMQPIQDHEDERARERVQLKSCAAHRHNHSRLSRQRAQLELAQMSASRRTANGGAGNEPKVWREERSGAHRRYLSARQRPRYFLSNKWPTHPLPRGRCLVAGLDEPRPAKVRRCAAQRYVQAS